MAHDSSAEGNQIFFAVRKGGAWPPTVFDLRAGYESKLGQLHARAAEHLGLPAEKLQMWRHKRELGPEDYALTLAELNMHTGFSLSCWDLTEPPEYWPAVKRGQDGRLVVDNT